MSQDYKRTDTAPDAQTDTASDAQRDDGEQHDGAVVRRVGVSNHG
jgi:hypothetical protein